MVIFWIFAVAAFIGVIGYMAQIIAVKKTISNIGINLDKEEAKAENVFPPISILKPMKGLDDNLFDNLDSFCRQDNPCYEVIFALQDYNDPAFKIAAKIRDRHPGKDISIVVEKCDVGLNPKVNNMIPAYRTAKYEHILISDSNVMVGPEYLRALSMKMTDERVGLVSSLIRGVQSRTLGSALENLHLNSFVAGSVCFLDRFLKMPCVIGKSMLMRKKDLELIGGLRSVKDFLAEDYIIGKRMHDSGRKVVLSNYLINNVNEYWDLKKFLNRHTRWGKLRWKIGGMKYLSELISNAVFMSVMPLILLGLSTFTAALAMIVAAVKISGDFYIGKKLGTGTHPLLYLLVPVKDLIIGCIWFVPLISSSVVWRNNRYIIGDSSLLSPYPETGLWFLKCRIAEAIKTRIV